MALLGYLHRDMLNRVLKYGDYVVWSNGKYNQKMKIGSVIDSTPMKVRINVIDENRTTLARPTNMIVITDQIRSNIEGNVGVNMDLEATRNKESK